MAALAVAIPSSVYVSVVMTESLAYLTSCWALLAIVLAVERPTYAASGGSCHRDRARLPRPRPARGASSSPSCSPWRSRCGSFPAAGRELRSSVGRLWPTGLALLAGLIAVVAAPVLRDDSESGALGVRRVGHPRPEPGRRCDGGSCTTWPTSTSTSPSFPVPLRRSCSRSGSRVHGRAPSAKPRCSLCSSR